MEIVRSIEIARPLREVHAYVVDPLNDPQWCPKVLSTTARSEEGAFDVVHRPVPMLPARKMVQRLVFSGPREIRWHEEDGTDLFEVTYQLEPLGEWRTRFAQRSVASVGIPRLLRPVWRWGIGRDLAAQLEQLRSVLAS